MDKRTRQGLGLVLIGGAAWGLAAVISLMADGALSTPAALVVGLFAVAGVVAVLVGAVLAGVSLLRGRS